ncbi:MAG: methanogenesis marker 5 protein [Halobacteriota archaeon]|nr:methanogenesis marker 5 protein [Halobacteriota archaeon]
MKVFIFPPNSLILSDLVERAGHEPLALMKKIGEKVRDAEIDSPPLNITDKEPKEGLRYAAIEVPAGVRGRLGLMGPLADEAEAAIILHDAPYSAGCVGCARSSDLLKYLVRSKDIPIIEVNYPSNEEEATRMVSKIMEFLKSSDGASA